MIMEFLFVDTFFDTREASNSSYDHTCCQLFVTDTGFVYVVPMKSKNEAIKSANKFSKDI